MAMERHLSFALSFFLFASVGCSAKYLGEPQRGGTGVGGGAGVGPIDAGSEPLSGTDAGGGVMTFRDGGLVNIATGPSFQTTVTAADPPPPISGGTLLVLSAAAVAVVADADRDTISFVDLEPEPTLRETITLQRHDEPGRLVEDAAGRVHVALRRGGALITVDPLLRSVVERREVCLLPRGLAYEAATDRIHVACAGGELVSLPAAGGAAVRTVRLDRDLRDVVVEGDHLLVSRFRKADVLIVDADGAMRGRIGLPGFKARGTRSGSLFTASTAWNMKAAPTGGALLLHQRGDAEAISMAQYYGTPGDPCTSAVHPALTPISTDRPTVATAPLAGMALAIDFALSRDGNQVAVIAAGNAHNFALQTVLVSDVTTVTEGATTGCRPQGIPDPGMPAFPTRPAGEVVAVAFDRHGQIVVQSREPAMLQVLTKIGVKTVTLSNSSRADLGHEVFHANAGAGLACASCHAEGQDDGRVWHLSGAPRRTMSLAGGIAARAPYHWTGDLLDFDALLVDTYRSRMRGPELSRTQSNATFHWVDSIPRMPAIAGDPAAIARGRTLFDNPLRAGCGSCHAGPTLTNNALMDVGTGGRFKVPSLLGVAWAGPYLHDGCATTLDERFGACGGTAHGLTNMLSLAERADLIAYLESL